MDILAIVVMLVCFVGVAGVVYILYKDSVKSTRKKNPTNKKKKDGKSDNSKETTKGKEKKGKKADVTVIDSQDLLDKDFDEIITCNEAVGLIKVDEETFVGLLEVRGINFNLMSSEERIYLEESFGELLNGIDFPIQFYTQSRKIDLDDYLFKYKENVARLRENVELMEKKGESEDKIKLARNQLIYGEKLLEYFIVRTIAAELLDRKYYMVFKYEHMSENYEHELNEYEIVSSAYSDIQNKAVLIIDSLQRNNLRSKLLSAMEIGEVLHAAYNRSDSSKLKFRNAVEAAFNHLYTTAKPIELKKLENEIIKSTEREQSILKEMEELQKELGA